MHYYHYTNSMLRDSTAIDESFSNYYMMASSLIGALVGVLLAHKDLPDGTSIPDLIVNGTFYSLVGGFFGLMLTPAMPLVLWLLPYLLLCACIGSVAAIGRVLARKWRGDGSFLSTVV